METYLHLMLIRFGLIAGGLVVLAALVFAIALTLRRRGRLDGVRRCADPAVKAGLRAAVRRFEGGRSGKPGSRPGDGRQ
ncbi:hypothetical protein [Streptomyces paromomycinus]|uniref:Uncharacterized protein n=1 Tax=Streptomyces paromomycinus TaxID=92743 RepID=A0A401VUJ7_STREY|nr:hypothetical protein [Streptomyces paromomycinus]GCD40747.1 hypothetical protein GKJPGBOP_00400 [Streptomyces paromomycinus]